jgi:hypothetical protein
MSQHSVDELGKLSRQREDSDGCAFVPGDAPIGCSEGGL